jgi:uncharacterized protein YjeT (DUF2065 family)
MRQRLVESWSAGLGGARAALLTGVDPIGQLGHRLLVADVEGHGEGSAPLLAHQARGLFNGAGELPGATLRRAGGADDVVAGPGQVDAEALADTAAGTGDESDGFGHGILPPRW